ncbi:MAG: hypothetical protein GX615_01580, partial [Lentisphaerae bacterium]|nr:hypothetical protein [Lentisphaerota bacterium]
MNQYTIQLDSMSDGLAMQESMQPNWAGIVLSLAVFGVVLLFAMRQMFGSAPFKRGFVAFKRSPIAARVVLLALSAGAVVFGGDLDKGEDSFANLYSRTSPSVLLMGSEEQ